MASAIVVEPAPMRILLVTTGLKVGGAEHQVVALARAFVARGNAVAILSLSAGQEIDVPAGVDVVELNMRKTPAGLVRALWQARGLVRSWRPDVIHAHMIHANVFARLLTRVVQSPPLVCTAHSVHEGGWLRMTAYRLTNRWAELTTHVSPEGRQTLIEARAVQADAIVTIPNGIDTTRFRPDFDAGRLARQALEIADDIPVILNVGRLVPEKNQALLIDAFRRLPSSSKARLLIAGEGPLRTSLQRQIDECGLGNRVSLLGVRRDIPSLLNGADLFVLSSDIEGQPLAVGEALACGCPVVATDAAGVGNLLAGHDTGAGTIVPRGNVEALCNAIAQALRSNQACDRADLQQRRLATHRRLAATHGMDGIALHWLRLYADLVHHRAWEAAPLKESR